MVVAIIFIRIGFVAAIKIFLCLFGRVVRGGLKFVCGGLCVGALKKLNYFIMLFK